MITEDDDDDDDAPLSRPKPWSTQVSPEMKSDVFFF